MRTNSVQLIGYVGQDLVLRSTPGGNKRASLRVATIHSFKTAEGKINYTSAWHDVVAWDNMAAFACGNFVKGSRILVEGRIVYRTYPDKTGHTRYITEIRATALQNLDR